MLWQAQICDTNLESYYNLLRYITPQLKTSNCVFILDYA